jgi:hypothetical protein
MPTKQLTPAQIAKILKFKIDWIKDPVPPFKKYLDPAALRQIKDAKAAFAKQIDQIVAEGIRR